MKTNKSIDDSQGSMDLSPTTTEAVIQGAASAPENKRRRLVRGAVAFAPLVLTLRSGALAAASCTGARLVQLPADGKFSPADAGDVCINADFPPVCPDYPTTPGSTKVLTQPASVLPVTSAGGPASGGGGLFYCGDTGSHLSDKTVAILSSASASFLQG